MNNKKIINLRFPYNQKPEFVGLKIKNGKIYFVFPVAYYDDKKEDIETNELNEEYRKDILLLLRMLSKYREPRELERYNTNNNKFPIESYLWIIRDYIENGYYKDLENLYNINSFGKINWKKTIKNNKIFLDNENVVYRELITKKTRYDSENQITQIHKCCVQMAINMFGFIYGLTPIKHNNIDLKKEVKSQWIQILRKELFVTFNDHKKQLLKHMIEMLEDIDSEQISKGEFNLVAKDFNYVFERLIDEKFGNDEPSRYYPQGEWVLKSEDILSTKIKPDTIHVDKSGIYVIDSKYYMYAYTKEQKHINLPDTSSIHKQITYAEYIDNPKNQLNKDDLPIYNIFLLPKNGSFRDNNDIVCKQLKEDISYIGYAKLVNQESKTYHQIYTFLINFKKLLKDELDDKCFDEIKRIVKEKSSK